MVDKIQIRADGNAEIGLGHLIRCFALAKMIKDEFKVTFYCKHIPESITKDIIGSGFAVNIIRTEEEWLELLTEDSIVVLDHYGKDTAFQARIKGKGVKLVCIDDLHDKKFLADLIINHSPGISPDDYEAEPYTSFALGPSFSLLRPAFIEAANNTENSKYRNYVMICFGGSDIKNLTKKVLDVVITFRELKEINVILGAAYPYEETIKRIAVNDSRINILKSLDEEEMVTTIFSSNFAIIPASGILLETIAGGSLPIICYYADNQIKLFNYFRTSGLLPFFNALNFNEVELKQKISGVIGEKKDEYRIPFRNEIKGASENHKRIFRELFRDKAK